MNFQLPRRRPEGKCPSQTEGGGASDSSSGAASLGDALLDTLPVCVYRKDREGRYTYVNRRMAARRGVTPAAMIGRTSADYVSPEQARRCREEDGRMIEAGEVFDIVEDQTRLDGERRYVHVIKMPLYDPNGACIGTQGVLWDVTEQVETEAKLREAQRQLIETTRLAGMAEVASGVMHHIGNLLNSVTVSVRMIESQAAAIRPSGLGTAIQVLQASGASARPEDGQARLAKLAAYLEGFREHLQSYRDGLLAEIAETGANVERIVQFLASQQRYIGPQAVAQETRIVPALEEAVQIAARPFEDSEVSVVRGFQSDSVAFVPRYKLIQILVALLSNAADACAGADRERRVSVTCTEADGRIRISVADTGCGISAEDLPRVFTFGFTTKGVGRGFALHNAALAARELGGCLTAESAGHGQGSTFVLEIPAARA